MTLYSGFQGGDASHSSFRSDQVGDLAHGGGQSPIGRAPYLPGLGGPRRSARPGNPAEAASAVGFYADDVPVVSPQDEATRQKAAAQAKADEAAKTLSAAKAASALFRAMDGVGTDERAALDALWNTPTAELQRLRDVYRDHYQETDADKAGQRKSWFSSKRSLTGILDDDITREMSGNDLTEARALLEGKRADAAAISIYEAGHGMGTDEGRIMRTLERLTPGEVRQVQSKFEENYKVPLKEFLSSEMNGTDYQVAIALASGRENAKAEADAIKIDDAIGWLSDDESGLYAILEKCKDQKERDALKAAYKERHKTDWFGNKGDLEKTITSNLSGAEADLATGLLAGNAVDVAAARLHLAASGAGTDEAVIFTELEKISQLPEVKADPKKAADLRAALKAKYNEKYGASSARKGLDFDAMLKDELKGMDLERANQLATNGELDPAFALRYAIKGAGTDEELIKKTLSGKSADDIKRIRESYEAKYGDGKKTVCDGAAGSLDTDLANDLSGREGFEIQQMMLGEAKTPEEKLARAEAAYDFERGRGAGVIGNFVTDAFSDSGDVLDMQHRRMQKLSEALASGTATPAQLADVDKIAGYHEADVKNYQEARDAITNTVAVAGAAVLGTAVTLLSLGTAGPVAAGILGAIASGLTTLDIKLAMQGASMSDADIATEIVMTLGQVATMGLGGPLGNLAKGVAALAARSGGAVAKEGMQLLIQQMVRGTGTGAANGLLQGLMDENTWSGEGNGFVNVLEKMALSTVSGTAGAVAGGQTSHAFEGLHGKISDRSWVALAGLSGGLANSTVDTVFNPRNWDLSLDDLLIEFGKSAGANVTREMGSQVGDLKRLRADVAARRKLMSTQQGIDMAQDPKIRAEYEAALASYDAEAQANSVQGPHGPVESSDGNARPGAGHVDIFGEGIYNVVDPKTVNVNQTDEVGQKHIPNLIRQDLVKNQLLPFEPNSQRIVTAENGPLHITPELVHEMARVVAPGGEIRVTGAYGFEPLGKAMDSVGEALRAAGKTYTVISGDKGYGQYRVYRVKDAPPVPVEASAVHQAVKTAPDEPLRAPVVKNPNIGFPAVDMPVAVDADAAVVHPVASAPAVQAEAPPASSALSPAAEKQRSLDALNQQIAAKKEQQRLSPSPQGARAIGQLEEMASHQQAVVNEAHAVARSAANDASPSEQAAAPANEGVWKPSAAAWEEAAAPVEPTAEIPSRYAPRRAVAEAPAALHSTSTSADTAAVSSAPPVPVMDGRRTTMADVKRALTRSDAAKLADKATRPDIMGPMATEESKAFGATLPQPPPGMIRIADGTLAHGMSVGIDPEVRAYLDSHKNQPTSGTRKVVVDGGGPTGILAALQAFHAGHEVTIVEQRDAATLPILWNNRSALRDILNLIDPVLEKRIFDPGGGAAAMTWYEKEGLDGQMHHHEQPDMKAGDGSMATGDPRAIADSYSTWQSKAREEATTYWNRLHELEAKEAKAAAKEGRAPRLKIMRGYDVTALPADGDRRGVVVQKMDKQLQKMGPDGKPELGPDGRPITLPYEKGQEVPDGYKVVNQRSGVDINLGVPDDLLIAEGAGSKSRGVVGAEHRDVGPGAQYIAGYFDGMPLQSTPDANGQRKRGGGSRLIETMGQNDVPLHVVAGTSSRLNGVWSLPEVDPSLDFNSPSSIEAYFGRPMSKKDAVDTYYRQQVGKVLQVEPASIPNDFEFGPAPFALQSHVAGPVSSDASNVHLIGDSRGNSHFFPSLGKVTGTGAHQMALHKYWEALANGLHPDVARAILDRRLDMATAVWLKAGLPNFTGFKPNLTNPDLYSPAGPEQGGSAHAPEVATPAHAPQVTTPTPAHAPEATASTSPAASATKPAWDIESRLPPQLVARLTEGDRSVIAQSLGELRAAVDGNQLPYVPVFGYLSLRVDNYRELGLPSQADVQQGAHVTGASLPGHEVGPVASTVYRGTPEHPGVVAGLSEQDGRSTPGTLLKLPLDRAEELLANLYAREYFAEDDLAPKKDGLQAMYRPVVKQIQMEDGTVGPALVFVTNPDSDKAVIQNGFLKDGNGEMNVGRLAWMMGADGGFQSNGKTVGGPAFPYWDRAYFQARQARGEAIDPVLAQAAERAPLVPSNDTLNHILAGVEQGDERMRLIHEALLVTFEGAASSIALKGHQRPAEEQALERSPVSVRSTAEQLEALYEHARKLFEQGIIGNP